MINWPLQPEYHDCEQDFHYWFGLSYASYLAVPRAVLEAMPYEWQHKLTALLNEMNETLDWQSFYPEGVRLFVNPRDKTGHYWRDPLRNYRRPVPIPLKVREQPWGECDVCHRKTWSEESLGTTCFMKQPDGRYCLGVFV